MTKVRCPACLHVEIDPPPEYHCRPCGRKLRHKVTEGLVAALQLGLFGEAVPVDEASRHRRLSPRGEPAQGGRWQTIQQSEKDALAVITEFFYRRSKPPGDVMARAEALLAGKSAADLRESALAAAWIAANCLRAVEDAAPGAGEQLLHSFALDAAE